MCGAARVCSTSIATFATTFAVRCNTWCLVHRALLLLLPPPPPLPPLLPLLPLMLLLLLLSLAVSSRFLVLSNTFVQTQRYDQCCTLFKELAAHELKYMHEDEQLYAFMIEDVLRLPPTAKTLRKLTRDQVKMIVLMPLALGFGPDEHPLTHLDD